MKTTIVSLLVGALCAVLVFQLCSGEPRVDMVPKAQLDSAQAVFDSLAKEHERVYSAAHDSLEKLDSALVEAKLWREEIKLQRPIRDTNLVIVRDALSDSLKGVLDETIAIYQEEIHVLEWENGLLQDKLAVKERDYDALAKRYAALVTLHQLTERQVAALQERQRSSFKREATKAIVVVGVWEGAKLFLGRYSNGDT